MYMCVFLLKSIESFLTTIRRYSLPSSGNNARVTSDFPETTRGSNLGGKTGKRPRKL